MRQICTSIENTVKDSRGLPEITAIKEAIKKEFAEFTGLEPALEEEEDAAQEAEIPPEEPA